MTSDKDWDFSGGEWLASIGQILYYAILVGVVVWLAWLLYVNRHMFQRTGARTLRDSLAC